VGDVAQAEADRDAMERAVRERQRLRVRLHVGDVAGDAGIEQPVAAELEHPPVDVRDEHVPRSSDPLREAEREVPAAGRDVERLLAGAQARLRDGEALPVPVQAERHHVVHQVVAGGDRVEDAAHLLLLPADRHALVAEIGEPLPPRRPLRGLVVDGLDHVFARALPAFSSRSRYRCQLRSRLRPSSYSIGQVYRPVLWPSSNTMRTAYRPTGSTAVIPTFSLPVTSMPSPAECPLTSAEGEWTRRYSASRSASKPSAKRTTSRRDRFFSVISMGSGAVDIVLPRNGCRTPFPGVRRHSRRKRGRTRFSTGCSGSGPRP